MFSSHNDYENYLKVCCLLYNMSKIGTKYPPENSNIGDNTVATTQRNAKSSDVSGAKRIVTAFVFVQGDPIIVELLREGQGDALLFKPLFTSGQSNSSYVGCGEPVKKLYIVYLCRI